MKSDCECNVIDAMIFSKHKIIMLFLTVLFTYNLRSKRGAPETQQNQQNQREGFPGGMPPGMRPPGMPPGGMPPGGPPHDH